MGHSYPEYDSESSSTVAFTPRFKELFSLLIFTSGILQDTSSRICHWSFIFLKS